jgi:hypothetical protein
MTEAGVNPKDQAVQSTSISTPNREILRQNAFDRLLVQPVVSIL